MTQAPLFGKCEVDRLRAFIKKWIRYGDRSEIIFRIDRAKILDADGNVLLLTLEHASRRTDVNQLALEGIAA